jgi:hypothetical protein
MQALARGHADLADPAVLQEAQRAAQREHQAQSQPGEPPPAVV